MNGLLVVALLLGILAIVLILDFGVGAFIGKFMKVGHGPSLMEWDETVDYQKMARAINNNRPTAGSSPAQRQWTPGRFESYDFRRHANEAIDMGNDN